MPANRLASIVLVLSLVALPGLPEPRAQTPTTALLRGRVTAASGGGIPGVTLVITSPGRAAAPREVRTDVEGHFAAPGLSPAPDYVVSVSYPGFAPLEAGPVHLRPGASVTLNLVLQPASDLVETVKVEARGHVVDTESSKTSTTYNAEFIEGLPVIGHDYQDILALAPGVTDTDGDGNPNVRGARATGLQYRLDGGNVTDPVSGTFGQNLNADVIEEIEIITSGASAEYGRADGGFANIITKSGGNDFEGKLSLFWQGRFLNGDGAGNNDLNGFNRAIPSYRDIRPTLSLGGAVVKDSLWYFGSVEWLDTESPFNQIGNTVIVTQRGHYGFGKLTWQADPSNKLSVQLNSDPIASRGLGLRLGVSPDSDFERTQGGLTPQAKWTATLSPSLLLESTLTHFSAGIGRAPVSRHFRPTHVPLVSSPSATGGTIQAAYPCSVPNCMVELGERRMYVEDVVTGHVNGPFFLKNDDERIRNALKTDMSYNVEDAWGQHNVRSGIEVGDEKYFDAPIVNPILVDETEPFEGSLSTDQSPQPGQVTGSQTLLVFLPLQTPQRAAGFNTSVFVLDAWKPRANLTINLGLRLDREDMDTSGFTPFDPRRERSRAIALWRDICDAAVALGQRPATPNNCALPIVDPVSGRIAQDFFDGNPPKNLQPIPVASLPAEFAHLAALDADGDGRIDVTVTTDRERLFDEFSAFSDRGSENFSIRNSNLSPRLSFAWDPWADGRTRVYGTWGRYYDRLFLATVAGEIGPDQVNFTFFPDSVGHRILPGSLSSAASATSITQVDRGLRTPRTEEFSLGIERELAPEWSIGLTYVRRRARDLLQDVDLNHYTCPQAGDVIGIDPYTICGDAGLLEIDRFGRTGFENPGRGGIRGGSLDFNRAFSLPNDAPDLYSVSPHFNQVFRIGNYNTSRHDAWELRVLKRLHRNWQMQASYTWSETFGQADSYLSPLGDDPETADDEEGYLDYDQRHLLRFQAVTRLPHEILLGTSVQYESGTPFSVIRRVIDQDSTGNENFRTFYPSGGRNDQRVPASWKIDGRLEKSFTVGRVQAAGYLIAENLLDDDRIFIRSLNVEPAGGGLLDATRAFGRRFEIGCTFNF